MLGDTWRTMWVTHGMPCVNMHGTLEGYKRGAPIQFVRQLGEGGGRKKKRKRGNEKRKGGKERRKGGKEKKWKEEKRRRKGRKRGKRKRKRKECCAVSRPERQRTRNCTTRDRFPPTLVILRLGAK